MNDEKFLKITKPVKFRRLRLLFHSLKIWGEETRYVIKYMVYYILYKLHIVNRYTYIDSGNRELSLPPVPLKSVVSPLCTANLKTRLIEEYHFDIDCFKFRDKVVFTVKDIAEKRDILTFSLDNVKVNIGGKFFSVDEHPFIRISHFPVSSEVVRYHLADLLKLKKSYIISADSNEKVLNEKILTEKELQFYTDSAEKEFQDYLNTLSLKDLEDK